MDAGRDGTGWRGGGFAVDCSPLNIGSAAAGRRGEEERREELERESGGRKNVTCRC